MFNGGAAVAARADWEPRELQGAYRLKDGEVTWVGIIM